MVGPEPLNHLNRAVWLSLYLARATTWDKPWIYPPLRPQDSVVANQDLFVQIPEPQNVILVLMMAILGEIMDLR